MVPFRQQAHSVFVSFGVGSLPLFLMVAYAFGFRRDFTDPSEIMLFPRSEADNKAFLISQMRLNDELSAELSALDTTQVQSPFRPWLPFS